MGDIPCVCPYHRLGFLATAEAKKKKKSMSCQSFVHFAFNVEGAVRNKNSKAISSSW